MKEFNIDFLYLLQELSRSISTLSIMVDSTFNSIDDMHKWKYEDKDEMKHLGGTLFQMQDKSVEFYILGISKIIEDFFNNLQLIRNCDLKIWDTFCDSVIYAKEIRLLRHLSNVIKHDNSIIFIPSRNQSTQMMIKTYNLTETTPINTIDFFKNNQKENILKHLYMTHEFCYEILSLTNIFKKEKQYLEDSEIVKYMFKNYIYNIPGHPKKL
ncbi:MAG: hypothetical protein COA92_10035 [Sulfurovum sp.]|nr:MAG: hypothetical protein COA92_10035 [Sulfurovum sp.]